MVGFLPFLSSVYFPFLCISYRGVEISDSAVRIVSVLVITSSWPTLDPITHSGVWSSSFKRLFSATELCVWGRKGMEKTVREFLLPLILLQMLSHSSLSSHPTTVTPHVLTLTSLLGNSSTYHQVLSWGHSEPGPCSWEATPVCFFLLLWRPTRVWNRDSNSVGQHL